MTADVPCRQIPCGDHTAYLKHCLSLAQLSPPQPTNFRVGALILDPAPVPPNHVPNHNILSTGFTLELPGNTHAEESALSKLFSHYGFDYPEQGNDEHQTEKEFVEFMRHKGIERVTLYTTMEPCNERKSGKRSCVERILALEGWVDTVVVGVKEPETFVGQNIGRKRLEEAGIEVVVVEGMEEEILDVAKAGHKDA